MQFDLIIIGGGLAGCSLAVALRDSGRRIALIESHPPRRATGWDARVYAISPASRNFLDSIGAWRHLDHARIAPVHTMDIVGDTGGALQFSAFDTRCEALAWIVEASAMACELWETVRRQSNVTLFCPAAPAGLDIDADRAYLRLDDGRTLTAQLVVGADGRDSWVRGASGLAATTTPYDELGVVANFACEREHADAARQWFFRDGVLAWLPLPGQQLSIVWSTTTAHARELLALPAEQFALRVAAAGDHALGRFETITAAAAFPLQLLRVPDPVAPRIALVGDAAHGIHPLSGHGINLGYRDANALANIIAQAPRWQDIGQDKLLRRYRRTRAEEVRALQETTHGLHQLFRSTLPGADLLRNLGLSTVNHLPFLKAALARYAMG